jgi:hypothetical protein
VQALHPEDVGALGVLDAGGFVRGIGGFMADAAVVDDVDVLAEERGARWELLDLRHDVETESLVGVGDPHESGSRGGVKRRGRHRQVEGIIHVLIQHEVALTTTSSDDMKVKVSEGEVSNLSIGMQSLGQLRKLEIRSAYEGL